MRVFFVVWIRPSEAFTQHLNLITYHKLYVFEDEGEMKTLENKAYAAVWRTAV
jgi:hypothetical protein